MSTSTARSSSKTEGDKCDGSPRLYLPRATHLTDTCLLGLSTTSIREAAQRPEDTLRAPKALVPTSSQGPMTLTAGLLWGAQELSLECPNHPSGRPVSS